MRRPRVLHVLDGLDDFVGGGENAARALALELPRDRFDVHLCTMRTCGAGVRATLEAAGVTVHELHRGGRADVLGHLRLLRLIHRVRPDVLHTHMYSANVPGTLFGRVAGVPALVAHEQTWDYVGNPVRKLLDGMVGRLADTFIAVSSADAERMHRLERVPEAKIELFPNAWSPRPPDPDPVDLRARLGIGPGAHVAGTLTVMRPQKRLDVLLEAFRLVCDADDAAHLLLGGDGPERPAVEAAVQRLRLAGRVHLLGYVRPIDPLLAAADVFVLSSDYEGTPLAVAEAMAAGLPVVATDVGGLPDVTSAASAVLVPRRDPAALAEGLLAVLADDERRARMGAAAVEHAATLTAAAHAARTTALYERLLAARGA